MDIQVLKWIHTASALVVPILKQQIVYSMILFPIIFAITRVIRKRSPYWHLGLWMILLLRLVLPPDLSSPLSGRSLLNYLPIGKVYKTISEYGILPQEVNDTPGEILTGTSFISARSALPSEQAHPWYTPLFLLWVLGVMFFFMRYVKQLIRYRLFIKHASPVQADPTISTILRDCCTRFGVTRPIRVVSSKQYVSPFTFGIVRPVIYLPERLVNSGNVALLESILAHETVHIKHYDNVWITLQHILHMIYFFCPLVWYANSQITILRECICDLTVVSKCKISRRSYGENLLIVLKLNLVGAEGMELFPSFSSQYKTIKYRIQNLQGGYTMRKYHMIVVCVSLLLFGLFFLPMANTVTQATEEAEIKLVCPIQKGHITARFGPMIDPMTKKERFHGAIDIAARVGTEIYVAADGTVLSVESEYQSGEGYGKNIIIQHANGYTTRYAKLSEIFVKEGQSVKAGEKIALSGNTGRSTGPHLHFELIKNRRHENPEKYIDFLILQK
jgi:beta-lactamase regulating signal transducer with metallopeptidase domain